MPPLEEGIPQGAAFPHVIRNLDKACPCTCHPTKARITGGKFEDIASDSDDTNIPPLVESPKKNKEDSEEDI